jgi:hypothetical protein
MTMTAPIDAYGSAAATLPDEFFLGQIVSFTITEADVNLEQMREELATRNLRDDTLKKRLRRIDAFKKASNDIATKFTKHADHQDSLFVRQVGQDSQESHRHVVFERAIFRVGQKRRLEHETIWKLMYDRGVREREGGVRDDSIHVEKQFVPGLNLAPEEQAWLDEAIGEDGSKLKERFEHYSTHLDSHGVRTFVREYLHLLGAINIKGSGGGGLYFVQQKHVAELRDLVEFVKSIESQMHLIPLLDIVDQREMLAEAFVQDTMDELRALSVEMGKILSNPNRTITEDTYDAYVAKAAALMTKAGEYESLLDKSLDTATMELHIFKQKTLTLSSRVRKPKSLGSGGKK